MTVIQTRARKHFKGIKAGEFKPIFSPGPAPSESDLVWVGDVPLPLEVYFDYLASKDRDEARRLVRPRQWKRADHKRVSNVDDMLDSQTDMKGAE